MNSCRSHVNGVLEQKLAQEFTYAPQELQNIFQIHVFLFFCPPNSELHALSVSYVRSVLNFQRKAPLFVRNELTVVRNSLLLLRKRSLFTKKSLPFLRNSSLFVTNSLLFVRNISLFVQKSSVSTDRLYICTERGSFYGRSVSFVGHRITATNKSIAKGSTALLLYSKSNLVVIHPRQILLKAPPSAF